jgi:acetyl esterase
MATRFKLDPQAQALLDLGRQRGAPTLSSQPPPQAREAYRKSRLPTQPKAPTAVVIRELSVAGPGGDVPVREYRPTALQQVLPALVFFHGGGWVLGDRDTHDVVCRMLCVQSGCAVYSVDYRLAPEHRFPAAFDDACAAVLALSARATELFIDPTRLAVGGDSAGGNLATAAALALRDAHVPKLAAQLLVYPVTDMCAQGGSYEDCASGYALSAADMHYFRDHYMADPTHHTDWRVSPLRAASLAGLPPALVVTAGYDPLRDEGRHYADRLAHEGVSVQHVCFERQMHGFLGMGGVIDEANLAVRLCADWLRHQLS